jgi:hypothetical protein
MREGAIMDQADSIGKSGLVENKAQQKILTVPGKYEKKIR